MAPTKANAAYAATTLRLLAKGAMKVIGKFSLVHVAAGINAEASNRFPAEKSQRYCHSQCLPQAAWLKRREINMLKSP
jgi:hypothetical protein